jgi:hypothetical protein
VSRTTINASNGLNSRSSQGRLRTALMPPSDAPGRYAVPTIYQYNQFTRNGGLMSYGGSIEDAYRTAGILAG